MKKMPKAKWQAVLPASLRPGDLSLDQLRDAKRVHELLTQDIRAPEEIAYYSSVAFVSYCSSGSHAFTKTSTRR
jgi:hypothetical protein